MELLVDTTQEEHANMINATYLLTFELRVGTTRDIDTYMCLETSNLLSSAISSLLSKDTKKILCTKAWIPTVLAK